MVVGPDGISDAPSTRLEDVNRLVADIERLRGPLRISVRATPDGLGIYIPPHRRIGPVMFLAVWMCGWGAGEYFALSELFRGGFGAPDLFLLIWVIPWTVGGLSVVWVVLWQLFGEEKLFFTAGALVREWALLWQGGRRTVAGADIRSVEVEGPGSDLGGMGTIVVGTSGRKMRIGSGLDLSEAELVAMLIRQQAQSSGSPAPA